MNPLTQNSSSSQPDIETINQYLHSVAQEVSQAFNTRNFELGKQIIIQKLLSVVPNHPIGLSDCAFAEKAMGNFTEAYRIAKIAFHHAKDEHLPDICDILTEITYKLNRFEESLHYARLAIDSKKRQVATQQANPLPSPKKLSSDKQRNIISFSLFGNNPRYCETAVINASLAPLIYPEWTCRFYVDSSVPEHVLTRLAHYQAQIIMMDDNSQLSGLFWRFLVTADPNVDCFIIRDCDSLISFKEQAAVKEWLNSGKFFHIMRDAIEHSELILAGMWGGYTGALEDINNKIQAFNQIRRITTKSIDQQFLRQFIYPTVAQSVLVHDSRHLEPNSLPFPSYALSEIECIPYFHIGMIDAHGQETQLVLDKSYKRVNWQLLDEHNRLICYYQSPTIQRDNQTVLVVHFPFFYSEKIREGKWKMTYQGID